MNQKEIDTLKQAIQQLYPAIETQALNYLLSHCQIVRWKTKEKIIAADTLQQTLFFLTQGLVRGFYVDDKGNEITVRFVDRAGWVTHYTALLANAPSRYTFQALEACTVVSIPFQAIQEGYIRHQGLERFGRLVAESVLRSQQLRIESFQFSDAETRYLEFIEEYPTLFNRVSLSHLSTYLGIQRQSLSRIRRKIAGA